MTKGQSNAQLRRRQRHAEKRVAAPTGKTLGRKTPRGRGDGRIGAELDRVPNDRFDAVL